jgi:hypothetical protein
MNDLIKFLVSWLILLKLNQINIKKIKNTK